MTIIEAIKSVIQSQGKPLTIQQILDQITNDNLYQFKAKYPKGVVATQIRRHCLGIEFPTANPVKHFILVGKNQYDIKTSESGMVSKNIRSDKKDRPPEEVLHNSYKNHRKNIEQLLLETILNTDPAFFEQLVIDLLLKMGYGENGSGERKGKSGDGGIDGEILQDRLGFDKIYIQAKRFSDTPVGRPDLQRFVGALQNITKGVFITTSSFSKQAIEYANEQQQKTLVLIDGLKLTSLMIDYRVGIHRVQTYHAFQINTAYFSENSII